MPRISLPAALNSLQAVGQVMPNLIAQDAAGRDVVAVAEPAGQAENLKLGQLRRRFEQPIDVQPLRPARRRSSKA